MYYLTKYIQFSAKMSLLAVREHVKTNQSQLDECHQ